MRCKLYTIYIIHYILLSIHYTSVQVDDALGDPHAQAAATSVLQHYVYICIYINIIMCTKYRSIEAVCNIVALLYIFVCTRVIYVHEAKDLRSSKLGSVHTNVT